MTPRVDILDERDSLRAPFLESVLFHASVFALLALGGISYQHSREIWGHDQTQAGSAVEVTPVKTIPLPPRTGQVNPVANDTESQVQQPPKPEPKKQVKEPEPKAVPLKSRLAEKQPRQQAPQRYRPYPPVPNQVFTSQAPAAVSPMFQKPGSGGVGIGQNSVFGNRFGAYADLVVKRVTENGRGTVWLDRPPLLRLLLRSIFCATAQSGMHKSPSEVVIPLSTIPPFAPLWMQHRFHRFRPSTSGTRLT